MRTLYLTVNLKKCSFIMWHVLVAVTAIDSDILRNILELLAGRHIDTGLYGVYVN